MPRKPKPAATVSTGGIALIEPSPVHWGDTIHFAVSGADAFDVRVIVQTDGGLSVSFASAPDWSCLLGPSPTWPSVDGIPVGGNATAQLETAPDPASDTADRTILATTTFAVTA